MTNTNNNMSNAADIYVCAKKAFEQFVATNGFQPNNAPDVPPSVEDLTALISAAVKQGLFKGEVLEFSVEKKPGYEYCDIDIDMLPCCDEYAIMFDREISTHLTFFAGYDAQAEGESDGEDFSYPIISIYYGDSYARTSLNAEERGQ